MKALYTIGIFQNSQLKTAIMVRRLQDCVFNDLFFNWLVSCLDPCLVDIAPGVYVAWDKRIIQHRRDS